MSNNSNELPNRRTIVKSAILGGAAAAMPTTLSASELVEQVEEDIKTDKECIMEAGLTEAEADCWEKTTAAAGAFFNLPVLHPKDAEEVAVAIHVLQNKLLGRPTYRTYMKIAKANHKLRIEKEKEN